MLKRYHRIVDQINAMEPEIRAKTDVQLRERTQEIRKAPDRGQNAHPPKCCPKRSPSSASRWTATSASARSSIRRTNSIPTSSTTKCSKRTTKCSGALIGTGLVVAASADPAGDLRRDPQALSRKPPAVPGRCFDVQLIGGLVLYEGKIAEMATGEGKTFVAPLACFMRVLEGNHCHVVTVNDYLVRRDANWIRPAFENLGLTVGFIQSDMEPGGEARRAAYQLRHHLRHQQRIRL